MISSIDAFIRKLNDYPGRRKWNRDRIVYTLYYDDFVRPDSHPMEFKFEEETERQREIIMCYFNLIQTTFELRDLEFYFRRFPYANTPITRYNHLSNCCELYFSKFYQYKERLKALFDAVEKAVGKPNLGFGQFIKRLDKEFNAEMRERHSVHHRQRFEDVEISRVFLIESMMQNNPSMATKGWTVEHRRVYRKAAKDWAKRCVMQSERLDVFSEAVAEALLKLCPFLSPEIAETP